MAGHARRRPTRPSGGSLFDGATRRRLRRRVLVCGPAHTGSPENSWSYDSRTQIYQPHTCDGEDEDRRKRFEMPLPREDLEAIRKLAYDTDIWQAGRGDPATCPDSGPQLEGPPPTYQDFSFGDGARKVDLHLDDCNLEARHRELLERVRDTIQREGDRHTIAIRVQCIYM